VEALVVMRQLKRLKTMEIDNRLSDGNKQADLIKYHDLVLATIDYYLDNKEMQIKTADFDSIEHYNKLKKTS
jgi:hypothetical protein